MTSPTQARVPAVTTAALHQEVTRLLERYREHPERVLLLRAHASEGALGQHTLAGQPVHLAEIVSALHAVDHVTAQLTEGWDGVLVLLTTASENELGDGLLSRAAGHRIHPVEPWRLIRESFGVHRVDPRLTALGWVADALLDAMPPEGWPRQSGPILSRDAALRALATRRLGLAKLHISARDLDASSLLRWSLDHELVHGFTSLSTSERAGLEEWLGEVAGPVAIVLSALLDSGGAVDTVALGVLCASLWSMQEPGAERAQGAVLHHISPESARRERLTDTCMREFAQAAEQLVRTMLASTNDDEARRARQLLDRAEQLAGHFGAQPAARSSALLRSGLDARIQELGTALDTAVDDPTDCARLTAAVDALRSHAHITTQPELLRRAEMAQRLVQWLAVDTDPTSQVRGVGSGIASHIAYWGWVDRAVEAIWAGEERLPELQQPYQRLYEQVRTRRRAVDAAFAQQLGAAGTGSDELLTVENVLPRIVAPAVTGHPQRSRNVLVILVDGMSAAVAAALGEEVRQDGWEEFDPCAGTAAGESPRRRAVAAALPTITRVSRTSLFAAQLTSGTQSTEATAFAQHGFWKSKKAALFHKNAVVGRPGQALGADLEETLRSETPVVGVVLNTVDDSLDKGRATTPWRVDDVAQLRQLLNYARSQERAVILTSDHGHIPEHGGQLYRVDGAEGARYRTASSPPGEGEVELAGSRVVHEDGRVVALWDPDLRYTAAKAGYHGGAALAEVAVPLLALVPFGVDAPAGWRALDDQSPSWWSLQARRSARPTPQPEPKPRRLYRSEPHPQQAALELDELSSPKPPASLAEQLLDTDLFAERLRGTPRRVSVDKVRAAVTALVDAGGVLSLPRLAEHVGDRQVRAAGFAALLAQVLNVDNYPVLEVIDGGRNVRLDVELLRTQFGLKG
ncbi:BREX-2 system phosphatase PglZ [Lipingzhangella sp. LS1_29]|uniref:BREX-2 system phosphatase PglZ n=1 Tax=Lipingzhangella rawalii TaxID=2055835 RepID=A0ABU2H833_9ACTN|nr:BREX-2 system phosphatase PglZ [Lipingzhangella rawalii]MDS1270754.1 BREX-2 system phosphatase PglZ [Lipingzhangella rawalii]